MTLGEKWNFLDEFSVRVESISQVQVVPLLDSVIALDQHPIS